MADHPRKCICVGCVERRQAGFVQPKVECQMCGGTGEAVTVKRNTFGTGLVAVEVECPRCAGAGRHDPVQYRAPLRVKR